MAEESKNITDTLSISDARKELSELLNRVAYGNERFCVERRGKALAFLISPEDFEVFVRAEEHRYLFEEISKRMTPDGELEKKRLEMRKKKAKAKAK